MHSASVAPERGTPAPLAHMAPVLADPEDLVPALESTLSALTSLELRHEIELDCLEEWSGPDEIKQSLLAECDRMYQQARAAHLQQLAELQRQVRVARPTH